MGLTNTNLKRGVFTSPQSGDNEFEMYVIENLTDLKKFVKETSNLMEKLWKKYLNEGNIILVYSNMISWCTENTTGNTHPSSFNRVKLLT